jgi:hypothetical protein
MTVGAPYPVPTPPAGNQSPPPPPGPGVQPPFAAPPTDGSRQRRWWAVGLAAGAALVLCVGGLFGLGGLVVLSTQVARDDAVNAVTTFLSTLRDGKYDEAYGQLCPDYQRSHPRRTFVAAQSRGPHIETFTVGSAELTDVITVPATINYEDRSVDHVRFLVATDSRTGAVEVCGEED